MMQELSMDSGLCCRIEIPSTSVKSDKTRQGRNWADHEFDLRAFRERAVDDRTRECSLYRIWCVVLPDMITPRISGAPAPRKPNYLQLAFHQQVIVRKAEPPIFLFRNRHLIVELVSAN